MQHPRCGGADALHRQQVFFGGFQHPGKIAEPAHEVMGQLVRIFPRVGDVQQIFQRLMGFQTVEALLLYPLPHPLAVPFVGLLFFGHGSAPFAHSSF